MMMQIVEAKEDLSDDLLQYWYRLSMPSNA
jgi:hypothetical protein